MTNQREIQPFRIDIAQSEVDDLRTRLAGTRWPATPRVDDWSRGVPVAYLKQLAGYWANGFDWRAQEAALNEIPQFTTEINGQRIHFFHQRSVEPDPTPLILTHGWPGSPVEFQRMIGSLTDPRSHGGDPADAFHVVVPSLPGYGFSNPIGEGGFNLFGVAQMWAELMSRLGYERYAAHGTDAGSGVAGMLPMVDPAHVIGIHLAGLTASTPFGGPVALDGLDASDRARAERFNGMLDDGFGYLVQQMTRPQTLAYSLNDSPVGQLAWIVEKFAEWTDPANKLPEEAVDRDQLLTNVSLYWFTGSGASSAHAVYEGMAAWKAMVAMQSGGGGGWGDEQSGDGGAGWGGEQAGDGGAGSGDEQAGDGGAQDDGGAQEWGAVAGPPTGVAVFGNETAIRSLTDPAGQIQHWTEYERGGHFAAMEVPALLTEDLRTFFRPLR